MQDTDSNEAVEKILTELQDKKAEESNNPKKDKKGYDTYYDVEDKSQEDATEDDYFG